MPYHRVLIGTDFSGSAHAATELARLLGDERTRYRVVHVAPTPHEPFLSQAPDTLAAKRRDAQDRLDDWMRDSKLPRAEAQLALGSIPRQLASAAAGMEADLVAVGHRGETKLQQLLLGSTARTLLRLTLADTLIARPPPADGAASLRRILVATDFHPPSARAAKRALDIAKEHDAQITVVHVIDPSLWYDVWQDAPPNASDPEWIANTASQKLATFNQENLQNRGKEMILHGKPALEIGKLAKETEIDLIVIGTHGAGVIERALLGSNAENTIEHAPCSVLLVR